MTDTEYPEQTARLLASLRHAAELAGERSTPAPARLRRLSSVVVANYPKVLFKLQALDPAGLLRVVPEFVTPMLQPIIDSYRSVLGTMDVRNVTLPRDRDSLIEAGLTAYEDTVLRSREEIERYFTGHFDRGDRDALGRVVLDELGIQEVLLLPVRPHEAPFGVISASSSRPFTPVDREYWRIVAATVRSIYRDQADRTSADLMRLAFMSATEATVLAGPDGTVVDVNHAALALLGYPDRSSAARHLGAFKECLPHRGAMNGGPDPAAVGRTFYLSDANGKDAPYALTSTPFTDGAGELRGAVIRLRATRADTPGIHLTVRQREVARLIMAGVTTKEIAAKLGLSLHTVNYHRGQLKKRLAAEAYTGDLQSALRSLFLGNA